MLTSLDSWGTHCAEGRPPMEGSAAQAVWPQDGLALEGVPPSRLAWLCQPERIERTLYLFYSPNHWAKARERLLFADRQWLYRVKAALVRQAFAACLVSPISYIDGSSCFAREFSLDLAADIEALNVEATKAFLQEQLAVLIAQARSSHRPTPDSELAALCLPFRAVERFLPEPLGRDLKIRPGDSRECGEFFRRTITEAEGRKHPLGEILRGLGVDVAAVCWEFNCNSGMTERERIKGPWKTPKYVTPTPKKVEALLVR